MRPSCLSGSAGSRQPVSAGDDAETHGKGSSFVPAAGKEPYVRLV